jgi:hypothetical protein
LLFIIPPNIVYFRPNDDLVSLLRLMSLLPVELCYIKSLSGASVIGCADVAEILNLETVYIWNPKVVGWNLLHAGGLVLD